MCLASTTVTTAAPLQTVTNRYKPLQTVTDRYARLQAAARRRLRGRLASAAVAAAAPVLARLCFICTHYDDMHE